MSRFYTSVVKYGNKLLFRYVNNGKSYNSRITYGPALYVPVNKETNFRSLDGYYLHQMKFEDLNAAQDFADKYKEVKNTKIFGQTQFAYQYISDEYPKTINWDKDLIKLFSLDIETATENGFPNIEEANEEILLITIKDNFHKQIVTFGTKEYTSTREDARYIKSSDESMMLRTFIDFWQRNCPDVITGWNINGFDIPYLVNRIRLLLSDDHVQKLSPWNLVNDKKMYVNGKDIKGYSFVGISTLDYLELYKKFTYTNHESYRLDYIAQYELGSKKLENPYETFKEFYTNDWDKFVKYNIHDVELVDQLEDKMKLIELVYTMAYNAKINFEDVFSPVRMWDVIIYNYLKERNIVIPLKEDNTKSEAFEGAYVKDPLVGQHKWVASFDLNSLYPHLIMQYNMSPETLTDTRLDVNVEKLLNKEDINVPVGLALTANGW